MLTAKNDLIDIKRYSYAKRYMLTITEQMENALEKERKKRMLDSIPETARMILSEYLSEKE